MKKIITIILSLYLSFNNIYAMENQQNPKTKDEFEFKLKKVNELSADYGTIAHLEWSPINPTHLACALNAPNRHTVQIWHYDGEKKVLLASLEHEENITSFSWHAYDETRFATATDAGCIYLWEWDKTRQKKPCIVKTIKAPKKRISCTCIKWGTSKNSKHMLAAAYSDNSIKIWTVGKKISSCTLKEHTDNVVCLAWSRIGDGDQLASASLDSTVMIWNACSEKLLQKVTRFDGEKCIIPNVMWHPNIKNTERIFAFSSYTGKKTENLLHVCNLARDSISETPLTFFPDTLQWHPEEDSLILISGTAQETRRFIQLLTIKNHAGKSENILYAEVPNFGPHIAWNPIKWCLLAIPEKNGAIGIYEIVENKTQ